MEPLLIADDPALEFLDTAFVLQGEPVELIGSGRDFVDWLVRVGLLDTKVAARVRRRFSAAELDEAAASARRFREWATDWVARWAAAPEAPYEAERDRLNALMLHASESRQLVRDDDGALAIVATPRAERVEELVGLLAVRFADLVTTEDPSLVKRCAGSACTLWFVDRTKAHRRRFCSPAACGNREKVAAFRERQRQRG